MNKELITKILEKLDKPYEYVAKKKHGKSSEILLGDFIYLVVLYNISSKRAKEHLNISEQTFNRIVSRLFPEVKLHGGGDSWSYFFLYLINHKKCYKCFNILHIDSFSKHHSACKNCIKKYNTSSIRRKENRENQKCYYAHNKKYFYEKHARYKAQLIKACPSWANLEELRKIYDNCPEGYHVDHIIPLRGKYICGLHIPDNLQYLSITDNCAKSNYHESEELW